MQSAVFPEMRQGNCIWVPPLGCSREGHKGEGWRELGETLSVMVPDISAAAITLDHLGDLRGVEGVERAS